MNIKRVIEASHELSKPYRVRNGKKFRLKDVDPRDTGRKSNEKERAKEMLEVGVEALAQLQDMLYGQDRWSLLLIFQAMDAAGKDGTIKHVMSGVNPQGCQVSSFKSPTSEDLDHDYLWRCQKALPERGRIGIFNRSYYEETLVVRVHPEFLGVQKLPEQCVTKDIWEERFQDIRGFERYLTRNGTIVRKFFLHVSKEEQQKRFLERLDDPEKNWKFSANDAKERGFWDDYMKAYEETIRETATEDSPWYVVPADNKWFTRVIVASAVIDALASMNLAYPKVSPAQAKQLSLSRPIFCRPGSATRRWPTSLPKRDFMPACLADWSSGCFAVHGTRRSPSRPPSPCSPAQPSAELPAAIRAGSAFSRRLPRFSSRSCSLLPGWSEPARSSTSSPKA